MASSINPAVQQTAPSDSTQRIATKTRIGVSSLVGGAVALGAGAAAAHYGVDGGIPAVASKVESFLSNYVTIPDVTSSISSFFEGYGYGGQSFVGQGTAAALGGAAFGVGAAVGAVTGKLTAHKVSLNDVKGRLGVAGSDLNFGQMHRVADVTINGGVFQDRSMSVQFKTNEERIRNLNNELTNTEFSLSSNAHGTSKARGTEDRFFDFEGARLANISDSSGDFVQALEDLKSAIQQEVKVTDKYTYQQGNSSTALNRREYILAGILGHAYGRGVAGSYLTAAVSERANTAKTNPKLADANFRQALQSGIEAGILAPNVDTKCYEGMVNSAAVASMASTGKNPDAVITSVFDSLKDAGLIESNLRARFIKDVREKIANPNAVIADPIQGRPTVNPGRPSTNGSTLIEKLTGSAKATNRDRQKLSGAPMEAGLDEPSVETASQRKARLAAEAEAQANSDVNIYSETLGTLEPRQKDLAGLYEKLITLLNEKAVPLDKIMEMGESKLRGALTMRHKQGFDLFDNYEANDPEINQTRRDILDLTDSIDVSRSPRPENFGVASREQRKAAEALEKQIKADDARISILKAKVDRLDAKIDDLEDKLQYDEGRASTYLFPATEAVLPEPVLPKEPGFFERLFSSKKAEASTEVALSTEPEITVPVEIEEGLDEPVTEAPVASVHREEAIDVPTTEQVETEDELPEPVVETSWKSWK